MRECPKCMSWWDGDTCPICEVQLMSEYSNNDGSDGVFADPSPDTGQLFDIIDTLAHECYELKQDNTALIKQINGSKS